MQYAEGPEYTVGALLCNDIQCLIYVLVTAREVDLARNDIIANPDRADAVVSRISTLLDEEPGQGEFHPHDAAIAAYLFVLTRASARGIEEAFAILRNYKRADMLWAPHMCRWIRQKQLLPATSTSYSTTELTCDTSLLP